MGNKIKPHRYQPLKHLGEGAFAKVFLAFDRKLNREVAIKVFKSRNSKEQLIRFEREAKICKDLRHNHIIKIYDATISGKSPNIVMEYINAETLLDLIQTNPVSVKTALTIGKQVGSALSYLHGVKILHRDIKPANIMIEKPLRAVLMDFNLAFSSDFTELTEEGFIVGTPKFMAPELFVGEPASESSDIYSLGLIIHDLLTSGSISGSTIPYATLPHRIIEAPSKINPKIPEEVDSLILWMTEKEQAKRCNDIGEFLKRVDEIQTPALHLFPQKKTTATKKTQPSSPLKRIPLKISAFLVLVGILVYVLAGSFNSTTGKSGNRINSQTMKSLPTDEHSPVAGKMMFDLEALARKCDVPLCVYEDFLAFSTAEQRLFDTAKHTQKNVEKHCKILKDILLKRKPETSFRSYLEYLFRFREQTIKGDLHNEAAVGLLDKSIALFFKELPHQNSRNILIQRTKSLETIQSMYVHLWNPVNRFNSVKKNLAQVNLQRFLNISRQMRASTNGKALFHTIVLSRTLCESEWNNTLIDLLLMKAPYSNVELVKMQKTAANIAERNLSQSVAPPQSQDQKRESSFSYRVKRTLTECTDFVKRAEKMKFDIHNRLKIAHPVEIVSYSAGKEAFTQEYDVLIKKYANTAKMGWVLMNLEETPYPSGIAVTTSAMNVIRRDTFKFDFLFVKLPPSKSIDEHGAASPLTKEMATIWFDSSLSLLEEGSFHSKGHVIQTFRNVLRELKASDCKIFDDQIHRFIDSTRTLSSETATALKVLYGHIDNEMKEPFERLEGSVNRLIESGYNLSVEDFQGWATIVAVLSNNLMLQMKSMKKEESRLELAQKILRILSTYYPGKSFNGIVSNPGQSYNGPENLRRMVIIHGCDAAHFLGKDITLIDEKVSSKIGIPQTLKSMASPEGKSFFKTDGIAAGKLINRLPLLAEDILQNSLDYVE